MIDVPGPQRDVMDNSPTTPLQGAQLTGGPLLSLAAHHRRGSSCYLPDQRSQDPGAGSEAGSEDHPLLNAVGIRAKTIMTLESIRVTPSRSRRQFARTNCRCARRALFRDHEPARASLGDWCESAGVVTLALEGGAESR